jgi:hypothetical protein
MTGERRTAVVSVVLLAAGLGLLALGGFVQFDDESGAGSEQWNLPLGAIGVVAAIVAVLVAVKDAKARLWLGIALGVLFTVVLWQDLANHGFRFIWHRDEGELGLLLVVLVLLAAVLVATGLQPSGQQPGDKWLVRIAGYLCGSAVLVFIAFLAGTAYYRATDCENAEGDCLAPLGGMVWGLLALPVAALAIAVIEVILHRRRQRQP